MEVTWGLKSAVGYQSTCMLSNKIEHSQRAWMIEAYCVIYQIKILNKQKRFKKIDK